jgi:hypothetical protein
LNQDTLVSSADSRAPREPSQRVEVMEWVDKAKDRGTEDEETVIRLVLGRHLDKCSDSPRLMGRLGYSRRDGRKGGKEPHLPCFAHALFVGWWIACRGLNL